MRFLVVALLFAIIALAVADADTNALFNKVHAIKRQIQDDLKSHPLFALKKTCKRDLNSFGLSLTNQKKVLNKVIRYHNKVLKRIRQLKLRLSDLDTRIQQSRTAHAKLVAIESKAVGAEIAVIKALIGQLNNMAAKNPRRKPMTDKIVKLLQDMIDHLLKRLKDLKVDHKTNALLKKRKRLTDRLAQLQKLLNDLNAQIAKLRAAIAKLNNTIAKQQKKCQDLADKLAQLLKALDRQLKLIDRMIKILQRMSKSLKDTGKGKQKFRKNTLLKLLKKILGKLLKSQAALKDPSPGCSKKTADLNKKIAEKAKKEAALKISLAGVIAEIPLIKKDMDEKRIQASAVKGQIAQVKKLCGELGKKTVKDLGLTNELAAIRQIIALVKEQDKKDKIKEATALKMLVLLEKIKQHIIDQINKKLAAAKKRYEDCLSNLNALRKKLSDLRDAISKLRTKLLALKSKRSVLKSDLDVTKRDKRILTKRLQSHLNNCNLLIAKYKKDLGILSEDIKTVQLVISMVEKH